MALGLPDDAFRRSIAALVLMPVAILAVWAGTPFWEALVLAGALVAGREWAAMAEPEAVRAFTAIPAAAAAAGPVFCFGSCAGGCRPGRSPCGRSAPQAKSVGRRGSVYRAAGNVPHRAQAPGVRRPGIGGLAVPRYLGGGYCGLVDGAPVRRPEAGACLEPRKDLERVLREESPRRVWLAARQAPYSLRLQPPATASPRACWSERRARRATCSKAPASAGSASRTAGRLIPGHGGLLDRVDALLAGAAATMLLTACGWRWT